MRAPSPPPQPKRRAAAPAEDADSDDSEDEDAIRTVSARSQQGRSNRTLIIVAASVIVALIVVVAIAAAWGPMQRSSQLAALDACREPGRVEESLRLARNFAQVWGPRSEHVVQAVDAGRGPVEARIELCRLGALRLQLAGMLSDKSLTPTQRGLVCAALSEQWPVGGTGPTVPDALADWALAVESDPALAEPALRLLTTAAPSGCEGRLANAASDGRLPAPRAVAAAAALGLVIERRGGGVAELLGSLKGPHRAALLATSHLTATVTAQALTADAPRLIALLATKDAAALGLAGLAGKRLLISENDAATRTSLAASLAPFLDPAGDDVLLGATLQVVRQQRLYEARARVLPLIHRLASKRPAGLSGDELTELLGRSMISSRAPAATAAADEVVAALAAAVETEATRVLAAVALSKVQEPSLISLRLAMDELAAQSHTGACAQALDVLIGNLFARPDLVKLAAKGTWGAVLTDDRRRRARYEGIQRWIAEHGEETTVRTEKARIIANKEELHRMRDEIRVWQESKTPLPIGVSASNIAELGNQVQLMLNMVLKASSL